MPATLDLVAFEMAVLSINWIVPIASGAMLSLAFRRAWAIDAIRPISARGVALAKFQ